MIYTDTLLKHSSDISNIRELPNATHSILCVNRLCGDSFTLYLNIYDNTIKDASFVGNGCAVSKASMNILVEELKGLELGAVETKIKEFKSNNDLSPLKEDTRKISQIREIPSRVKCLMLGWNNVGSIL